MKDLPRRAERRPRDDRGWIIPKEGMLSRKIYNLLVEGKGTAEIASKLGIKVTSTRVLAYRIRHSERFNTQRYNAQREAA